ncbi:tyrosine-type recombinase/integrase [Providencia rettgeri]|uniref:Tyrosine-type recombinase/integrase n=1 Tax=Providencia rettgeri TaxID=587 RepID=A0A939NFV1_PRORE|nr:tyrosine-type recombinase/integrase [Providencia rettgeri]
MCSDLGLRIGEIARLSLDDIDWVSGTITLRRTKGRRDDVMPLPVTTGNAIVAYLQNGRPKTLHREVFASHKHLVNVPLVDRWSVSLYARYIRVPGFSTPVPIYCVTRWPTGCLRLVRRLKTLLIFCVTAR